MTAEEIAAVLEAHRSLIQVGQSRACTCGWEDGYVVDVAGAYRAHVAQQIAALLPPATETRQVWCVAYDSDTPSMDGTHPPQRMAEQTLEQAERNLGVLRSRSRAPKRNLRIETRWVTEWEEVAGDE